jgi:hypothetical protein
MSAKVVTAKATRALTEVSKDGFQESLQILQEMCHGLWELF